MKRVLLAVMLLLLPVVAFAGTGPLLPATNLAWTAPATYVGGAGIPGTDILTYKLHCGLVSGTYPLASAGIVTVTTAPITAVIAVTAADGHYFCVVDVTDSVFGLTSGFSNEADLYKSGSTFLKGAPVAPVAPGTLGAQ